MKSGKRLGAIMLAAAGSLAFLAAPAEAARGNVLLTNSATGLTTFIADPSPGCHRTGEFDTVRNSTDVAIVVYQDAYCRVGSVVVQPGTTPVQVGARLSVFIPR
ncbi:hypothetical protein [Nonomuraea dietziae]|uniref:hypothetical protein n=1 Tax=Nonomuraea dietziae TaxID=65515 RepID=UPI003400CC03